MIISFQCVGGREMNIFDNIYGNIEIDDTEVKNIINTKLFQRLKFIKQQGNTYFYLQTATHNRFEHSIGVYKNTCDMISFLSITNQM